MNPKNVEETFPVLDGMLAADQKEDLIKKLQDNGIQKMKSLCHHGLGRAIRNRLGLWSSTDLAKYFISINVPHPDDMSGIIMEKYFEYLLKGNNEK
jgi:hypothetical protein